MLYSLVIQCLMLLFPFIPVTTSATSAMPCREDLVVCHDDCCDRETQFCNDREMRCQSCGDRQVLCGNYTMPPACDLFCYKLQQAASTAPPQCKMLNLYVALPKLYTSTVLHLLFVV